MKKKVKSDEEWYVEGTKFSQFEKERRRYRDLASNQIFIHNFCGKLTRITIF